MVSANGLIAVTVVVPPRLTKLPLIVKELFANCAFVTVPDNAVVGMVVDAVKALVPFPIKYPVKLAAPEPPEATFRVPPRVRVPATVIGPPVNDSPVVPPEPSTLVTVPDPAIFIHWVLKSALFILAST